MILIVLLAACESADTPSSRVVITEPLAIPGLDRERRLRIYLPPAYDSSDTRFPVIYLHDAQNLFDDATAYAGEWQVDESLDALAEDAGLQLIAVGIDNGAEERMNEMAPWKHRDYGEPQADAYLDFIVTTVKPRIDADYRTLPDRANTAMLGSSMGGLVTHYAAYRHTDTFSRVGVFSPSYWWSESVYALSESPAGCPDTRFYLLMGEAEDPVMLNGALRMHDVLQKAGCDRVLLDIVPDGEHNEALWRGRFTPAIRWLFADGTRRPEVVKN